MTAGTYEIRNKLDGMAYGGNSGDIEKRWQTHLSMLRNDRHHCEYFQNAWNKYGEDVFEFIILEVIEDPDERLAAEQKWLDIHHANKTCYNIAITAGPAGPRPEEFCRKMSRAAMGHAVSDKTRRKMSASAMGNQNSLGRVVSSATRRKISKANTGYKHTDAAKRQISEAQKGNQHALGCTRSKETRRRMSVAQRQRRVKERRAIG